MEEEGYIVLKDVRKVFGSKKVLNGINVSVPKGQSLVVIAFRLSREATPGCRTWPGASSTVRAGTSMVLAPPWIRLPSSAEPR